MTTFIIGFAAGFVIFFSFMVFALMFCAFVLLSKSHTKSKWIQKAKNNQETVISLAIVSFIINLYIICLASSALRFWCKYSSSILLTDKHCTCTGKSDKDKYQCQVNLAAIMIALIVDILNIIVLGSLVMWVIFIKLHTKSCTIILCCDHCSNCKICNKLCDPVEDYKMAILSLTVLCPIFCVIAHTPYIAIAYLNDGDHASSIFIYYTILFYIFFGVTKLFVHWGYHIKPHKRTNIGASNPTFQQGDDCETHCVHPSVPVSSNSSTTQNGGVSFVW